MTTCLNCGTEFEGNYCPECGQSAKTKRITFGRLFKNDFLSGLFNVNQGFWRACKELTYKPGYLTIDYIEGKRKAYINFIGLLLVLLAIEAVLMNFAINSPVKYLMHQIQASLDARGIKEVLSEDAIKSVFLNQKLLFIAIIPIAAFVPWLICRKLGYNWVEHMVVITMLLSLNTLFGILTVGWVGLLPINFDLYAQIYAVVSLGILAMDFLLFWQLLSKANHGFPLRFLLTFVSAAWVFGTISLSLQFAMGFITAMTQSA